MSETDSVTDWKWLWNWTESDSESDSETELSLPKWSIFASDEQRSANFQSMFQVLFSELMRNRFIQFFNVSKFGKLPNSVCLIALPCRFTVRRRSDATSVCSSLFLMTDATCARSSCSRFISPDWYFWNHRYNWFVLLLCHLQILWWYSLMSLLRCDSVWSTRGKVSICSLLQFYVYTLTLPARAIMIICWHSGIFKHDDQHTFAPSGGVY